MYKYSNSPSSIIRISDGAFIPTDTGNTDYAAAMAWVSAGNSIGPADVTPFATLKQSALQKFRGDRELYLNRLAGISADAQGKGLLATVTAIQGFRQGLLDLTSTAAVVGATDLPSLNAAMKSEYNKLVLAIPLDVRAAFAKIDQV